MTPLCLIIGRSGLLGSALSTACASDGLVEYQPTTNIDWSGGTVHEDIRHVIHDFAGALGEKDWIMFWAAGIGTMASSSEEMAQETALFQRVLDAIESEESLLRSKGQIVFASSAGAVYAGCLDETITESSQPLPLNPYGKAKLSQEELLLTFVKKHDNTKAFIARISNLYGTGQSREKKQGLLSHIARSILRHTPIHIYVPLDTIRDYISADDAAALIVHTVKMAEGSQKDLTAIIASEEPVCIAHIIGIFRSITRTRPRLIISASPLGDSYIRRIKFRSTVVPAEKKKITSLHHGAAEILSAERAQLANLQVQ